MPTVAKGTISKSGVTEVILQEGKNIRAVAYINRDRTGRVELQCRTNVERDWYCKMKEFKTVEDMKHTLLNAGIKFCPECEATFTETICPCKKSDLL